MLGRLVFGVVPVYLTCVKPLYTCVCRGSVKVFSRVYPVSGDLVSSGLGGERGGPQPYIYISVLVGFPVVFSTLVGVVFGDLAEEKVLFW